MSSNSVVTASPANIARALKSVNMNDVFKSAPRCLEYVRQHAQPGNAASVIAAIDQFANDNPMMNVGDDKGAIVDAQIRRRKPVVMVELGGYSGYSAVRFASLQQQVVGPHAHFYSCEYSPEFADIVREMAALAGLANHVTVITGAFADQYKALADKKVDMVFIDHDSKCYVSDTQIILDSGMLRDGSVLIADNVLFPGAPDYLDFVDKHPKFQTQLHRVQMTQPAVIEDAIHIATYKS